MPNVFSRIPGLSPRVSTASRKLFAIVSATVSTAGLAMSFPSAFRPASDAGFCQSYCYEAEPVFSANSLSTPRFLLLPAPLAPRAFFLGAEIEFLDVLGMHQPLATVVHDDAADLQHIAVMRRLQRDPGALLDQQDRHARLLVDPLDDGEDQLDKHRRESQRRLVEQQ